LMRSGLAMLRGHPLLHSAIGDILVVSG
jgi:hypothetical protein